MKCVFIPARRFLQLCHSGRKFEENFVENALNLDNF